MTVSPWTSGGDLPPASRRKGWVLGATGPGAHFRGATIVHWLLAIAIWAIPNLAIAAGAGPDDGASGGRGLFYFFAVLTLFGAIMTVTRRHPIHSALFLVLTLLSTAGIYLMLQATFLAAIQVLVYAGAIVVLFVFVVMSFGRQDDLPRFSFSRTWFFHVLGLISIGMLCWQLVRVLANADLVQNRPGLDPGFGTIESVGRIFFSDYLLAFEAVSITLVVAILGAVLLTERSINKDRGPG